MSPNQSTDIASIWITFFLLILVLAILLHALCYNMLYLTYQQKRDSIINSYVNTNFMNNTIQFSTLDFPFTFCKKGRKAFKLIKRAPLEICDKSAFLTGEAFKESQKSQANNAIIYKGSKRSGN